MSSGGSLQDKASSKVTRDVFRIVVYAGPTGGHLFPAQSFSEAFSKHFPGSQIDLVTCIRAKTMVDKVSSKLFRAVHYLPDFGFPARFSWRTFKPFLIAPYLFFQAFTHLQKKKPSLCVGFGSFASYPGMIVAHGLGIPTLIHEQNMIPGMATRWLAPHMDAVAVSFPGTRMSSNLRAVNIVGLPLRSFILEQKLETAFEKKGKLFTLLVVGGSQGAKGLNIAVVDAMSGLSREERSKIAVIHITGSQDCEWVSERYRQLSLSNEVYPFHTRMDELFKRADFAVTRAGANTLFELAFFGIPALVVPYPHAGGHQKYNAQCFAERGGLLYHDEGADTKEWLVNQLRMLWKNPGQLALMTESMRTLAKPMATEMLVEVARKLIKKA